MVSGSIAGLLLLLAILLVVLFGWWAFTWSTHTLAWAIFMFGSVLGAVKVSASN